MSGIDVMKEETMTTRPPVPPFTRETAVQKVRLAEAGWNCRDPEKVSLAYTLDSRWRNRSEFVSERAEIVAFLTRKWSTEAFLSFLSEQERDHCLLRIAFFRRDCLRVSVERHARFIRKV